MTKLLDRKVAPSFVKPEFFKVPEVVQFASDVPFWGYQDDKVPLFKLELIFAVNKSMEEVPGVGLVTSRMFLEGTSKLNSTAIQDFVARYGAHFEVKSGLDRFVVTLYSQKKYGVKMIAFIEELIYDSVFPEQEFTKVRDLELENLRVNNEKTSFVASNEFRKMLFTENHSYGRVLNEKVLGQLSQKTVVDFYTSVFKPSLSEVYISGGYDSSIVKEVEQVFINKKLQKRVLLTELASPVVGQSIYLEKEKAIQSSIRIGKHVVNRVHPEYTDMIIANEVLGGYFGSRLMKNIREEKGLTYGIYSQCATYEKSAFWVIAADVKKELVKTATEEVYKEVTALITEGVDDEEMEVVTNYMAGSFLSSINTPFDIIDKFKLVHYGGVTYDYYREFYDRLGTITSQNIQDSANKYFTNTNELIVG